MEPIEVELPDGRILEVPAGSSAEFIKSQVQRFMAGSHDNTDDSESRPSFSGRANPLSKDISVACISFSICASGA